MKVQITTIICRFIIVFALLGYGTFSVASEDEPRWFEIEVIVFKSLSQKGLDAESWDKDVAIKKPDNLVDFLQPKSTLESEDNLFVTMGKVLSGSDTIENLLARPEDQPEDPQQSTLNAGDNQSDVVLTNGIQTEGKPKDHLHTDPALTEGLNNPVENSQANEPIDPQLMLTGNDAAAKTILAPEQPFVPLDESALQLIDEVKTLNRHPEYRVITHLAWRQPVLGSRDAEHVRIAGGQDYSQEYFYDGSKILFDESSISVYAKPTTNPIPSSQLEAGTSAINTNRPISNGSPNRRLNQQTETSVSADRPSVTLTQAKAEDLTNGVPLPWVPEIDGDIQVYLSRFLHIKTNLYLRIPGQEEVEIIDLDWTEPQNVHSLTSDLTSDAMNNSDQLLSRQFGMTNDETQDSDTANAIPQSEFELNHLSLDESQNSSTEGNLHLFIDKSTKANARNNMGADSKSPSQFSWELDDSFLESDSQKQYIEKLFNYPIQQSRRVRSGELHYFDHPLAGILIIIRPFELTQEITEAEGKLPPSL